MANQEHLDILNKGVNVWNQWRKVNKSVVPDLSENVPRNIYSIGGQISGTHLGGVNLSGANLSGANLSGTYFRGANLREAQLNGADLSGANLSVADLTDTNLNGADLRETNFSGADLIRANLSRAELIRADLSGADLSGAILGQSIMSETKLESVDLSLVIGLDAVEHRYPSIINLDTIYRSKGIIPEVFLRGCSVSDDAVAFVSLVSNAKNQEDDQLNDSVSRIFNFPEGIPEEIRVSCEQYLIYFVQFLKDVGIEADAKVEHKARQILFSVTPRDPEEALEKVREALDWYLILPSQVNADEGFELNADIAVQRMAFTIGNLKGQLRLALAEVRANEKAIEAQDITIRQLMRGEVFNLVQTGGELEEKDREELLGGAIALKTYEVKGLDINLPHIFRALREKFARPEPPSDASIVEVIIESLPPSTDTKALPPPEPM